MTEQNKAIKGVPPEFGEHIYHYTSIKALYGILKNKEFWWGNTASMNDRKELLEFIGCIEDCIRADFAERFPDKCEKFIDLLRDRIGRDFPFAMCFSAREEDASQWERYADGASGVCIKMNSEVLYKLFEPCNVVFNGVYYDFDIRNHEYYRLLKEYFEEGKIDDPSGIGDAEGLVANILANAPGYKNRSFWAECERRIYTLPGTDLCSSRDVYEYGFESKDKAIRSIIKIRYDLLCEEVGVSAEELFEEIVIGPRSIQNIDELKSFCEHMGFPGLASHIRVSTCPLR